MELRHIRYFLAVADEQNFTRAAARLGIGQPPLSQQIKDLEAEVGAPLFHRIPQGAELTAAGHAFLAGVRVIPIQVERAVHGAQRAARGEIGSIRVGFTNSVLFDPIVASTIRSFRRAYPDVELTLQETDFAHLVSSLREGELDAVFLRSEVPGSEDLQLRFLSEEPMLAVLPSSHPAARSAAIDLMQLRNDPLIVTPRSVGPTLFDKVISVCQQAGFEPVLMTLAPQISSVVTLVAAELGFSLLPASMRQLQMNGVVYREIRGEAPVAHVALAYRRGETSKIVRNFVAQAIRNDS